VGTDYPDIELEHLYTDNAFYQMMLRPTSLKFILPVICLLGKTTMTRTGLK